MYNYLRPSTILIFHRRCYVHAKMNEQLRGRKTSSVLFLAANGLMVIPGIAILGTPYLLLRGSESSLEVAWLCLVGAAVSLRFGLL